MARIAPCRWSAVGRARALVLVGGAVEQRELQQTQEGTQRVGAPTPDIVFGMGIGRQRCSSQARASIEETGAWSQRIRAGGPLAL
jgi:hypothetical protein